MGVAEYTGFVAAEGERFLAAAEAGDLGVTISGCEGWDMREMIRHLGLIHLWAAGNLVRPKDDWLEVDDLPDLADIWPDLAAAWPDDGELIAWYRSTLENLISVLRAAPPDVAAFTWLPAPSPLSMWARRQASEIAIHRFDAENSRGMDTDFDPSFAADMLDELLSGFAPGPRAIPIDDLRTIHVHAEDTDQHWRLEIGPDGIETTRDDSDADLTVSGTAAELYLLMWNRTSDSSVSLVGDASLMDLWRNNCRVRWS